jgi:DNA-binding XRE family transcriptional regulator
MKSTRELIGERIKEIRNRRKMTQEDVAKLIEIDPKSISRIERGEFAPSLDTIEKIAYSLSVEIKDLFEFEHLRGIKQTKDACQKMLNCANEGETKILLKIMRAVIR